MRISFGHDAAKLKAGEESAVYWDSSSVVNGHMLLTGMSGSGKTYTLRRIIDAMAKDAKHPLRVHVFDIHGDIDIDGASTVMYSEQTNYGINPLEINPDPHYGGIRKRIQSIISTIDKTSRKLGGKQEAVLRNLLTDVYAHFGFRQDDPKTWLVDKNSTEIDVADGKLYLDVPIEEKDEAKKHGARWDAERRSWYINVNAYCGEITQWMPRYIGKRHPTLTDALRYAQRVLKVSFLGSSQQAVQALEAFNRAAKNHHTKLLARLRRGGKDGYLEDSEEGSELEKAGEKAIRAYTQYIESVRTGVELSDVLKYDSIDVLKSVCDRLENLDAIGVFKSRPAPHDPKAIIWRDHIKALAKDEQKLFVLFKLEMLFYDAVQRGESNHIRDVIIVDEASNFFDDSEDNILNTIAKEARKFGIALICASQAPTHFTDDFVSSVGTKIVLGIDEMFWDASSRKLRLDPKALQWIKLTQRLLIQIKQKGEARNDWRWVVLRNNEFSA